MSHFLNGNSQIALTNTSKPSPPTITLKTNDGYTHDPQLTSELLAEAFATSSSNHNYSKEFLKVKNTEEAKTIDISSDSLEDYNSPLTLQELQFVLSKYPKNIAPGPDNIPIALIRNLPEDMIIKLLHIYNKIWLENCIPCIWLTAIVVPILKPNKEPHSTSSFRPIALTCGMCKILEKMIARRLLWKLRQLDIISSVQCGFMQGHSTLSHLTDLHQKIRLAFERKQYLISIFFDIEKAYDTAWRRGIINKLMEAGLRGHLVQHK